MEDTTPFTGGKSPRSVSSITGGAVLATRVTTLRLARSASAARRPRMGARDAPATTVPDVEAPARPRREEPSEAPERAAGAARAEPGREPATANA